MCALTLTLTLTQVEIGARSHLYLFSVHWFIRRFVIAESCYQLLSSISFS